MNDNLTYEISGLQTTHAKLDTRIRLVVLAFYSICIFFADTWMGMAAFALIAIALCMRLRPQMAKLIKLGIIVYVIAALTIVFNSFLISGDGISFNYDGFQRGLFYAARIVLLVMASLIVCLTTDAISITSAISSFLSIFSRTKLPIDDIATVLSIALRFIPLTAKEYLSIKEAQWSRGANFDDGPVLDILKAHCSILIPLFINMFRKADKLAMSMDSRGYGISGVKRINIGGSRLNAQSLLIGLTICALCVASAIVF